MCKGDLSGRLFLLQVIKSAPDWLRFERGSYCIQRRVGDLSSGLAWLRRQDWEAILQQPRSLRSQHPGEEESGSFPSAEVEDPELSLLASDWLGYITCPSLNPSSLLGAVAL